MNAEDCVGGCPNQVNLKMLTCQIIYVSVIKKTVIEKIANCRYWQILEIIEKTIKTFKIFMQRNKIVTL